MQKTLLLSAASCLVAVWVGCGSSTESTTSVTQGTPASSEATTSEATASDADTTEADTSSTEETSSEFTLVSLKVPNMT